MTRYKIVDTTYFQSLLGAWETENQNEFVFPSKEDAETYFRITKYELMDTCIDIDKFFKIKNTKDSFEVILETHDGLKKMILLRLSEVREDQ